MNKLWLLLNVLVIALFVVSCAPKEEVGEGDVEEIEEVEEGGALAGQAISGTCNDPDAVSSKDVTQVLINSTTFTNKGKWVDQCQTVNGKVILKEGICIAGKMATWQYACSKQNKLPGDKYDCEKGACVNKGTPTCTPNCAGKTCGDNGCGGLCGECADDEECQSGQCVLLNAPAPTCTPGLTGKSKCVSEEPYIFYYKEYIYSNCTIYYMEKEGTWKNNDNKTYCGYKKSNATDPACMDDKGCCGGETQIIAGHCEGNFLTNTSKNVCTGQEKVNQFDCTKLTSWTSGKPNSCTQNSLGKVGCYETCTLGENISICASSINDGLNATYACSSNGFGWEYKQKIGSCPVGQTCKFFSGKDNGLCG